MEIHLTNEILARYIGGQLEVQSQSKRRLFRGEISDARIEDDTSFLVVELAWCADGEGFPPIPRRWVESRVLEYGADLDMCVTSDIGPSGEGGDNRISLMSQISDGVVVFFPPNGSKLDRSKVEK